jgi:transposase
MIVLLSTETTVLISGSHVYLYIQSKEANYLKVIHPICAGIDVHKSFMTIAIITTKNNGVYQTEVKTFSTMIDGIEMAISWLNDHDCHVVVIESTGKYWIPVFNLMEDSFSLTLANPYFTKTFPGNKTDRRDAKWLAELHRLGLVQPSFIPPKPIRELRDLTRYRHKLVRARSAEKSRIHNILTVCNIMLSSVATDIFGKSGMNIMHALLQFEPLDEDLLSNLVLGKLREKIPQLQVALKGQLSATQADKLSIALDNLKNFNNKIAQIENLLEEKVKPFESSIKLLCSCFAIKKVSAIVILSEIGADMSSFPSAQHLCSWAGVCPQNNETGGKRRSAKTKKGNRYLKAILTQCVNTFSRSKKNSRLVIRFHSLKIRRGHNKAVMAVCRSLLIAIFHMLSKGKPFTELSEPNTPKEKSYSFLKASDDLLIEELAKRGYKLEVAT